MMPSNDPMRILSGDVLSSTPISVATIALDEETQELLKLWISSFGASSSVELADYPDENRSMPEWAGEIPLDICLIDFDWDASRAFITAEQLHHDSPETAIFAISGNAQPDV